MTRQVSETSGVDPPAFGDDETVRPVVGDETTMSRRFKGDGPDGRSLYG
nr:hypothetical protein StreXyl84_66790 [Streptomyces sp. Xyl84]